MGGLLIILSSPSGGGKTSVIRAILQQYPADFVYSISATTRPPRPGEIHGYDYLFLSPEQFQQLIDAELLLEWEQVHGYYYGTPKQFIEQAIDQGKMVLLDVDVNGALRIAKRYPQNCLTIFLAPPSMEKLVERLQARKTDSEAAIHRRLERIPMEMKKSSQFDYVIINDDLQRTIEEVVRVIHEFRKKRN